MQVSIILPSLNPDEKLLKVVNGLIAKGFDDIIIINDGSEKNHCEPFDTANKMPQCTVLTHEVNKGKGRALKTGFEYFINNRSDKIGVVTVDGDNQHHPDDIYKCAERMISNPEQIVLGARDFSQSHIPKKSKFGNRITSGIFKFACGINISDTQTGLRAIPLKYLHIFMNTFGERFEYETNMLLEMKENHIPFVEEKIQTIYIEDNKTSHFNPITDSIRIYSLIFKFLLSSVFSFLVDIIVFTAFTYLLSNSLSQKDLILVATFGARIISSIVNFTLNRKAVFKSDKKLITTIIKYYILCIIQATASFSLVYVFSSFVGAKGIIISIIKMVVDTTLYFISFQIQREWVFNKNKGDKNG